MQPEPQTENTDFDNLHPGLVVTQTRWWRPQRPAAFPEATAESKPCECLPAWTDPAWQHPSEQVNQVQQLIGLDHYAKILIDGLPKVSSTPCDKLRVLRDVRHPC